MEPIEQPRVKRRGKAKAVVIALVILFFLALIATSSYFFYQYVQLKKQYQGNSQANAQEVQKIVGEVSKLMLLPKGETPTIATVSDITKLKGQPFFDNAKNGDRVLIYANAKEAVLYDPIANLIINVAPITLGSQTTSQAQQAQIALRNGTITSGLTNTIESKIVHTFPGALISSKDQDKTLYDKTLVIPLSTQADSAANDLAKLLNATVGTLPATEIAPANADILIIIGKNQQ